MHARRSLVHPASGRYSTIGLALVAMAVFGTSFWAILLTLRGIPPITTAFLRPLVGSLSLVTILYLIGHRTVLTRPADTIRGGMKGNGSFKLIAGMALLGSAIPNVLQNIGMLMMDPGSTSTLASLIQGAGPIFTILLAALILKERLGVWKIIGLATVIPATVVLTTYSAKGFSFTSRETIGGSLNLLTALCYSGSGILLKTALNRGADPPRLIVANGLFASVMTLPVLFLGYSIGWEAFDPSGLTVESVLAFVFISVGIYGCTGTIWYKAYQREEVSRITFFVFLLPVFSAIVGFVMLGEVLSTVQIIAAVAVLTGVGIAERPLLVRGKD